MSNRASGIAWVSNLCNNSIGYSLTQVFKPGYLMGHINVISHEVGHTSGRRTRTD
jgi:hypothetical protein